MYTTHGHQIPGTADLGVELPGHEVVPCGGPPSCEVCQADAVNAYAENETAKENAFHYAVAVAELFEALRQEVKKNYQNSRERALVLTNVDQAELWLTKCEEEK